MGRHDAIDQENSLSVLCILLPTHTYRTVFHHSLFVPPSNTPQTIIYTLAP